MGVFALYIQLGWILHPSVHFRKKKDWCHDGRSLAAVGAKRLGRPDPELPIGRVHSGWSTVLWIARSVRGNYGRAPNPVLSTRFRKGVVSDG